MDVSSIVEPDVQVTNTEATQGNEWRLYSDGSSCIEGAGSGLVLTTPTGKEVTYALRFDFQASNNES